MPFSTAQAVIAAMLTPAFLILASASLIATALVRLARVVDRLRKLAELPRVDAAELERASRRAQQAERAILLFFIAVVIFVIDGATIAIDHWSGGTLGWLPIGLTVFGMLLMVGGAGMMVAECALAAQQIRAEVETLRAKTA